ncbi:peroxiredoxin [uncultured Shewanella sp.]|uniref:peroxiredoxin family protein n=1 Tax=Shewanella atlantica TaxID=271099 RepID=UPI00262EFBB0|nr:TlpA disulfide reductase family protein [uncultured Shewanella sp.]
MYRVISSLFKLRRSASQVVALLFALTLTFCINAEPLSVGERAPDFTLKQTDNSTFTLSDYRGKRSVYLVFWNTWCGYCMKKVPDLIAIEREFGERVELLAINTGWSDSLAEISQFQARFEPNYAIAFDDNADVTHRYGVIGTPTSFLIDINGVIRQVDGITHTLAANIERWNRLSATEDNAVSLAGVACEKESLC